MAKTRSNPTPSPDAASPAAVKKTRGRPRKEKQDAAEQSSPAGAQKGRGRPRKEKADQAEQADAATPHKGRGRPRKTATSEDDKPAEESQQEEATPTKKQSKKQQQNNNNDKPSKKEAKKSVPTPASESSTPISPKGESFVDKKQVAKAISELSNYVKREAGNKKESKENADKKDLFEDEDDDEDTSLFVSFSTKKFINLKHTLKPKVIQLSHPFQDQNSLKTCLIVKDNLITDSDSLSKVEALNLPSLQQIITVNQLKTEWKPYEKRRQLHHDYDLFLADDSIFNILPSTLGKEFFAKGNRKTPIPIRVVSNKNKKELSETTLKNQFNKVLTSTTYVPPVSNNVVIRAGSINKELSQTELVENVQDVIASFNSEDLRAVFVKTTTSPALPIFYTDKIYSKEDILENVDLSAAGAKGDEDAMDVDTYEQGLLELADEAAVTKVLGKKLKQKKNSSKATAAKKAKKL